MAKMFYSLEEAAQTLGVSEDRVKEMAGDGTLQQFRDRDKVMFKVEQVDKLAGTGSGDAAAPTPADDTGGPVDEIDLASAVETDHDKPQDQRSASATGVSVFEADEVDTADPMAQTVVSDSFQADDDELALESVGSGSGLLDLTRESDDTSLGAELLEEIYPAGGSDAKTTEGGSGFEGIFDAAGGADSGPSAIGDVEAAAPGETVPMSVAYVEPSDPGGSGLSAGLLIGAGIAMVICLIVIAGSMAGIIPGIATTIAGNMMAYAGGLAVLTIVFGVIGMFVGKAMGR